MEDMMRAVWAALTVAMLPVCVGAQTPPVAAPAAAVALNPAAAARVDELVRVLGGAGDPATLFSPEFLAKVPAAQVTALAAQLKGAGGEVTGVERVTATSPWSATLAVGYQRGVATMRVAFAEAAPHPITGLRIDGLLPRVSSLDEVDRALAALPGRTGLVLARLGEGAPTAIRARAADEAFAIGSEFKLVILAELVRAVAAGERRWTDEVTLDGAELPGGLYTQQPRGTKVTLRALAERMISVSDNSATDILLKTLGRDKVEAMLPVVGIARPAGMKPFLGTLEAFKLKGVAALGERWATLDEAGRRRMLAGEVAKTPGSAIVQPLFFAGKPLRIDTLEWFASPADMVRVMDWLRRNTEGGPAAEARAILAVNPGVGAGPAGKWRYLGYKGGSETGVIAMTFLLQGKDGQWQALSASWNNRDAAVDDTRFAGLMARAVELAAER
jgi:hypothetical protein